MSGQSNESQQPQQQQQQQQQQPQEDVLSYRAGTTSDEVWGLGEAQPVHPDDWKVEHVGAWVASLGAAAGKFRGAFEENEVDGPILFELDDETLEGELGVSKPLVRKRIARGLAQLKEKAAAVRRMLKEAALREDLERDHAELLERAKSEAEDVTLGEDDKAPDVPLKQWRLAHVVLWISAMPEAELFRPLMQALQGKHLYGRDIKRIAREGLPALDTIVSGAGAPAVEPRARSLFIDRLRALVQSRGALRKQERTKRRVEEQGRRAGMMSELHAVAPNEVQRKTELGRGASGVVYESLWNDDKVAAKLFHVETADEHGSSEEGQQQQQQQKQRQAAAAAADDERKKTDAALRLDRARRVMEREALTMRRADGPNTVRLFSYCPTLPAPFLLMSLAQCGSVAQHLELLAKESEEAKSIFSDAHPINRNEEGAGWLRRVFVCMTAASALAHCHARGVLHRDVAAKNFLIESHHPVKVLLADFGLSILKQQLGEVETEKDHRILRRRVQLLLSSGALYAESHADGDSHNADAAAAAANILAAARAGSASGSGGGVSRGGSTGGSTGGGGGGRSGGARPALSRATSSNLRSPSKTHLGSAALVRKSAGSKGDGGSERGSVGGGDMESDTDSDEDGGDESGERATRRLAVDAMQRTTYDGHATEDHASSIPFAVHYMDQQALQMAFSEQTDVYAFGCFLYEVVTLNRPFGDKDAKLVAAAKMNGSMLVPPLGAGDLPDDVPPGLVDIMRQCFTKKDPRRPAKPLRMATVRRSLRRLYRELQEKRNSGKTTYALLRERLAPRHVPATDVAGADDDSATAEARVEAIAAAAASGETGGGPGDIVVLDEAGAGEDDEEEDGEGAGEEGGASAGDANGANGDAAEAVVEEEEEEDEEGKSAEEPAAGAGGRRVRAATLAIATEPVSDEDVVQALREALQVGDHQFVSGVLVRESGKDELNEEVVVAACRTVCALSKDTFSAIHYRWRLTARPLLELLEAVAGPVAAAADDDDVAAATDNTAAATAAAAAASPTVAANLMQALAMLLENKSHVSAGLYYNVPDVFLDTELRARAAAVRAMERWPASRTVQSRGCALLAGMWNSRLSPESYEDRGPAAVNAVVRALAGHSRDIRVRLDALRALRTFKAGDLAGCPEPLAADGFASLTEMLRAELGQLKPYVQPPPAKGAPKTRPRAPDVPVASPANVTVVEALVQCLFGLCLHERNDARVRKFLASMTRDTVLLLLCVVRSFPTVSEVQEGVVGLLQEMAREEVDAAPQCACRAWISELGGIDLVIDVMERFEKQSHMLQAVSAALLGSLALLPSVQDRLVLTRTTELICRSFLTFPRVVDVVTCGLRALARIASASAPHQAHMHQLSVIPLHVQRLLTRFHRLSPAVLHPAVALLAAMTAKNDPAATALKKRRMEEPQYDSMMRALVASTVNDLLFDIFARAALVAHVDPTMLTELFRVLINCDRYLPGLVSRLSRGMPVAFGLRLLLKILVNERVAQRTQNFVARDRDSFSSTTDFATLGSFAISFLVLHPDAADLQSAGLEILSLMAVDPASKNTLHMQGAVDLAVGPLKALPGSPRVQEFAARTLARFCEDHPFQQGLATRGNTFPDRAFSATAHKTASQVVSQDAADLCVDACRRFPDDWDLQDACLEMLALASEHKLLKNRGEDSVAAIRAVVKAARKRCPKDRRDAFALLDGRISSGLDKQGFMSRVFG